MGQIRFKTTAELEEERLEGWRDNAKVSAFQARAALVGAGLLGRVEALMAEQPADSAVAIAWEYATEFRRRSPTVLAMAQELELDDEALDEIFASASEIEA